MEKIELVDYGNGIVRCPNVTNDTFAELISRYLGKNPDLTIKFISEKDYYGYVIVFENDIRKVALY
jgi:hypothetical protein